MLAARAAAVAALFAATNAVPVGTGQEHRALFQKTASSSISSIYGGFNAIQQQFNSAGFGALPDDWEKALTAVDSSFTEELRKATSTDEAGQPHLYFHSLSGGSLKRCGQVDAAPYMPASLFERANFLSLAAYAKATVQLYKTPLNTPVVLGTCAEAGYTSRAGGVQGISWTPRGIMGPVCKARCQCSFIGAEPGLPSCRDQGDDPSAGRFCSLCGPSTSCPGCTALNTVNVQVWYPPAPAPPAPTARPTTPPPTRPANPNDKLWFRVVRKAVFPSPVDQCGEVNAAPRMPGTLFERSNRAALQRYVDVTLKNYVVPVAGFEQPAKLELGRCAEVGYTVPAGTGEAKWDPPALMKGICKKQCNCDYTLPIPWKDPTLRAQRNANNCNGNAIDRPLFGTFCSLCYYPWSDGDLISFNKVATIDLFTQPPPLPNIVSTAVATADLSTLVAAVTAADLGETLSGPGPFTVFAPTNAAFAKIQPVVNTLLLPENKAQLVQLLTYHVLASKVLASAIKNGESVATVEGQKICFEVNKRTKAVGVFPCGSTARASRVTTANVLASNGVVHIIDQVLVPVGFSATGH